MAPSDNNIAKHSMELLKTIQQVPLRLLNFMLVASFFFEYSGAILAW